MLQLLLTPGCTPTRPPLSTAKQSLNTQHTLSHHRGTIHTLCGPPSAPPSPPPTHTHIAGDLFHMRGQLSEAEVKVIMLQLLSAVQYLHRHGVWHRDIKSANILMTYAGGQR
jgi:hypothetical protein